MNNKLIANYEVFTTHLLIIYSDIRNPFNIYFHIKHILSGLHKTVINWIEWSKVGIFINTFLEQDGDACHYLSRCSPILVNLPSWQISLPWAKL